MRATNDENSARGKLAADVEAYLADGGTITQCKPKTLEDIKQDRIKKRSVFPDFGAMSINFFNVQ